MSSLIKVVVAVFRTAPKVLALCPVSVFDMEFSPYFSGIIHPHQRIDAKKPTSEISNYLFIYQLLHFQ